MLPLLVEIPQGKLNGKQAVNHAGGTFNSYQGIPYAKPPVGDLRFKAPEAADRWEGILDCTAERSESLAKHFILEKHVGSEDSLYLNVYAPRTEATNVPVMVWIHGGGFCSGSSKTDLYGPEHLMMEDIVLVTFNYRLGILGFLSLEDPSLGVPGNNGLKDMVLALKWVQENIRYFKGDPDNVTIFGESAGSAAVHLLMLSPMGKGLFHKAIMQSGSSLNPWVYGTRCAKSIAKAMNFKSDNEKEIYEMLKTAPAQAIYEAQMKVPNADFVNEVRPFSVVVEKPGGEQTFLDEDPLSIILSGNYTKVPLIIGYNSREGIMVHALANRVGKDHFVYDDFRKCIPFHYKVPEDSELAEKIAEKIKRFYFPNKEITPKENMDIIYQIETDTWFYRGIYIALKHHLQHTTTPTYFYRFSFSGKLNIYKVLRGIDNPGASHCDDLPYIFGTSLLPAPEKGSREEKTMYRMVKLWTNFAKTGNPNKPEQSVIDVTWNPATKENLVYLDIADTLEEHVNPDIERMELWDSISKMCPTCQEM